MSDVVTLGEILVDFVPEGGCYVLRPGPVKTASPFTGQQGTKYVLRPGGAPSNVAVNLRRWGMSSGIIGKLGADFLGDFMATFLKKNRVDITNITRTSSGKTGLVFVFINKYKDRDFSFYGDPSADKFLAPSEIRESIIKKCKIFHYGSISMMGKTSREAALKAISLAKKHKKIVSYDPNVRLNLWEGKKTRAKKDIRSYFKFADVVKISDAELKFLFNAAPEAGVLGEIFKNKLVFVSAGAKGCYIYYKGFFRHVPGYNVRVVDTTGAGDAFMAGVLCGIIKTGKGLGLTPEELVKIARFANKKGAAAVTRKGAV
jgi:fructokinase